MFLTSGEELHEATREAGMSQFHSDALVLFGAKGDLAFKKIFPALHAMVKRGRLNVPVIAVARGDWNHEQLRATANASIKTHSDGVDPAAFLILSSLLRCVADAFCDPAAFNKVLARIKSSTRSLHYPRAP